MKSFISVSLISSLLQATSFAQVQQGSNVDVTNGQQIQQIQQGQIQQGQVQQLPQIPQQNQLTNLNTGNIPGQTPTAEDLASAVSRWQADTSAVSNFLNTGPGIQNQVQFKREATVALNAEIDELNHKAIIDAALGADPNVIAANSTLATAGAFQDVVDKLEEMSVKGLAAAQNIDLISQNRCVNVLPNIDAYFAATGSNAQAIRPNVCDQTGVINGVQGAGRTLPGQAPGTPDAAFAAAQALAAGTGNGFVQAGGAGGFNVNAPQQQGQIPAQVQGQLPPQGQGQLPSQGQVVDPNQVAQQGQVVEQAQNQVGNQG